MQRRPRKRPNQGAAGASKPPADQVKVNNGRAQSSNAPRARQRRRNGGNAPVPERQHPMGFAVMEELVRKSETEILFKLVSERSGFELLLSQDLIEDVKLNLCLKLVAKACKSLQVENVKVLLEMFMKVNQFTFGVLQNYIVRMQTSPTGRATHGQAVADIADIFEAMMKFHPASSLGTILVLMPQLKEAVKVLADRGHVDEEMIRRIVAVEQTKENVREKEAIIPGLDTEPPNDFRSIPVFPDKVTITDEDPFLRGNLIDGRYLNADHYLDVQFRLLREDFMRPLRQGIAEFLEQSKKNGRVRVQELRVYTNVRVQEGRVSEDGVVHTVNFETSGLHNVRWEENRRLIYGTLVCLTGDRFQTMLFGVVNCREEAHLRRGFVDIKFDDQKILLQETQRHKNFVMVETEAYFEAYRHVLLALQGITEDSFPLKEYILEVKRQMRPPEYLTNSTTYCFFDEPVEEGNHELKKLASSRQGCECTDANLKAVVLLNDDTWPTPVDLELDDSQYAALKSALTQKLSIIQGPPGTGKTYVGLRIIQRLIHNCSTWIGGKERTPILVVCYTNHALDQFLEGVLKFTRHIIRIGGRSSCETLRPYNLRNVRYDRQDRVMRYVRQRSSEMRRSLEKTLTAIKVEEKKLKMAKKEVLHEDWLKTEMGPDCFINLLADAPEIMKDERNPKTFKERGKVLLYWLGEELPEEITKNLEKLKNCEETGEWKVKTSKQQNKIRFLRKLNSTKPFPGEELARICYLWDLNLRDRWRLYRSWIIGFEKNHGAILEELAKKYEKDLVVFEEVKNEEDVAVASKALVVGMTTTGAAKHRYLVQGLQPKIVIVEEAAEVLESHIVTSLSQQTQQLILIGDHQQLRPTPTVYELAKKYNLDVSLFERLIRNGIPYCQLGIQHRMRPCISKLLVPHIYKNLEDHSSVYKYEDVKGFRKNMFFLNHQEPEMKSANDETSKVNMHEAQFLITLCRYILRQGYAPGQVTILTTYLGQLHVIKRIIGATLEGVRVSVVDNFQGEENDIILLSLVRSNEGGKIGFLKTENRVCVALSRAKRGLFCIGNFDLLAEKSWLWANIVEELNDADAIGPKLSLRCQNHGNALEVATIFELNEVPDGGCTEPCNFRLTCGHSCRLLCHPGDPEHTEYECLKPCEKISCILGHKCLGRCCDECGPCMMQITKTFPGCRHTTTCSCSETSCPEPCPKILPCGHNCRAKCGEDCGTCPVLVNVQADCNHNVAIACSSSKNYSEVIKACAADCQRDLSCGHRCPLPCGWDCQTNCDVMVTEELPCGHQGMIKCHEKASSRSQMIRCKVPCQQLLDCGHKCVGDCGSCFQGRLHKRCQSVCERRLVCGHICRSPCSASCPPCSYRCDNRCFHSRCHGTCGAPCFPCLEPCGWFCKHHSCTKPCSETCDRGPCNKACYKRLPWCGHLCIGLCGEPCPDLCRVCHKNQVTEIFFGHEDERDARFIMLEDCGHVFEVEGLRSWFETQASAEGEISVIRCPKCSTVIRRNLHFNSYVKTSLKKVEVVKKRIFGDVAANDNLKKELWARVKTALKDLLFVDGSRSAKDLSRLCKNTFCDIQKALSTGRTLSGVILVQIQNYLNIMLEVQTLAVFLKQRSIGNSNAEVDGYLEETCKTLCLTIKHHLLTGNGQQVQDMANEVQRMKLLVDFVQGVGTVAGHSEASTIYDEAMDLLTAHRRFDPEQSVMVAKAREEIRKLVGGTQLGVSEAEKFEIVKAMGFASQGHWYQCPEGHVYCIADCGGATVESKCPDCGATIGGQSHTLRSDNSLATAMDGATAPAWSETNNLQFFRLGLED